MGPNPQIDALITDLLDKGVSPKYISRLAAELEDHCADLEEESRRLGFEPSAAAADAHLRLGEYKAIASEFERRPELRSWVYTSGWLIWLLRALVGVYLLLSAPVRAAASGQEVLLRYAAATAAGATVTFAMLFGMNVLVSPATGWLGDVSAGLGLGPARVEADVVPLPAARSSDNAARAQHDAASRPGSAPGSDRSVGDRGVKSPPAADEPEATGSETRSPDASVNDAGRETFDAGPSRGAVDLHVIRSRAAEPFPPRVTAVSTQRPTAPPPALHRVELTLASALAVQEQDLRPVIQVRPEYPWAAARRGLEGYVVVEYTVTRTGRVEEAVVVESSNDLFNRAALEAANGFKYNPRILRGEPVDVQGVRTLIRFELEA